MPLLIFGPSVGLPPSPIGVLWTVALFIFAQACAFVLASVPGRIVAATLLSAGLLTAVPVAFPFLMPDNQTFAVPTLMFASIPVLLVAIVLGSKWALAAASLAAVGLLALAPWLVAKGAAEHLVAPTVMLVILTIISVSVAQTESRLQTLTDQRARELEDTNAELVRAARVKSEFLSNMSHELRTPLNSIIGFSGTLFGELAGPITEEQRIQLSMIDNSGRHLLELINGLLDFSRIEAEAPELTIDDVDLQALCQNALNMVRPMADAKGLTLESSYSDSVARVRTDPTRLTQILLNLLANAVKFTDSGSVRLDVSRLGPECVLSVSDTGCGFPEVERERIFEPFYQVRPLEGGKTSGTGLGLSVSHQLAGALGARLEAESTPDEGSTFRLLLPVEGPPR